jgi:3-oxoacyl-ACP reductase-like protein
MFDSRMGTTFGMCAYVHGCARALVYVYWEVGRAHRDHVLVAAAAAVDEDVLVRAHRLGELHGVVDGVRRLQRRDDALEAGEKNREEGTGVSTERASERDSKQMTPMGSL